MTPARRRGSAGQSSVLLLAVLFVLAAVVAALVGLGAESVHRGRVQAIADLTALAATHGESEGRSIAGANGAAIVALSEGSEGAVTVTIERGGRRAVASATR